MVVTFQQETPNARSEYKNSQDDGKSQHHINQYIIGEEIGRGSFGAVHLAVDQYGQEYVRLYLYIFFIHTNVLGCQRVLEVSIKEACAFEFLSSTSF